MAQGGARIRSGPKPDEGSARSDRRGYSLTALPAEGFKGVVPTYPLPRPTLREKALWAQVWTYPQACAWAMPSERWRWYTVALWVRTAVVCEGKNAQAADKNSLHRFADQIGLTTAGLAEMGWKVATDDLAAKTAEHDAAPAKSGSRFAAVTDAGQA